MKKKLDLVPGQKYRGYALLNEYGEFEFTPENTGSRAGAIKTIVQKDEYTLSSTKKFVIVHIRLDREKGLKLVQKLLSTVNDIISQIRNYEI